MTLRWSYGDANTGKEACKFNWGCTICRPCRSTRSDSIVSIWPENRGRLAGILASSHSMPTCGVRSDRWRAPGTRLAGAVMARLGRAREGGCEKQPEKQSAPWNLHRSYPPGPLLPALKTAPQPPQAPSPLKLFLCDSQGLGGRVGALLRLCVFRTGLIERRSRLLFGLSLSVSIRPFLSDRLPAGIAICQSASAYVVTSVNRPGCYQSEQQLLDGRVRGWRGALRVRCV